jgi:hypothetical protein
VGIDPKEGFTQSNEASNVQDGIRRELVELHAIDKKQPTKKFMGRKRETSEEKGNKHHPVAARGLGDALCAGEDDWRIIGEEPLLLGLGQI